MIEVVSTTTNTRSHDPVQRDEKVVIIDDDLTRRQSMESIIRFLGCIPTGVGCSNWRDSPGTTGSDVSFLIGRSATGIPLKTLISQVLNGNNSASVFVLDLDGDNEGVDFEEAEPSGFVLSIKYPLNYLELSKAFAQAQGRRGIREGKTVESTRLFRALVGRSKSIERVRNLIHQVGPTDATVLILGETGTGKEIVARNVHYFSKRRKQRFVPINCGAIPPDLLESELFGHEKGAFTGAITARQGRFELANGGTLFLDEIGDMPLPMQVKLLRVLQEQTFERVGGTRSISVDVRVIAATHRNVEDRIREERFRQDLYYRLNVFPIETPPLRERIEDLPLLLSELITRLEASGKGSFRPSAEAIKALSLYPWPGNVRELANLAERLAITHPFDDVHVRDLPSKFLPHDLSETVTVGMTTDRVQTSNSSAAPAQSALPREGMDLRDHLSKLEISFIGQALDDSRGVVAQAANRLGMRRTTLVEKMRKYGIRRQD